MKISKSRLREIIKEELTRSSVREASNNVWPMFERLLSTLGPETLLQELMSVMSDDEARANFEHIAQMHDIDLDDEDDDELGGMRAKYGTFNEASIDEEYEPQNDDVEEIAMEAENDGDLYQKFKNDMPITHIAQEAVRKWVHHQVKDLRGVLSDNTFLDAVVQRLEQGTTYGKDDLAIDEEHGSSGRDLEDKYRRFTGKYRSRGKSRSKDRRATHKKSRQQGKKQAQETE